jgi:hypothetical protein
LIFVFAEIIEEDRTEAESDALIAAVRQQGRRPALTGDAKTLRLIKAAAKSTVRHEIEAFKREKMEEVVYNEN